jgi:hypothetical protein
LRERREDIPDLMQHFLERYFRRRGREAPFVSETARSVHDIFLVGQRARARNAHEEGTFTFYCNLTEGPGCRNMRGEIIVTASR